MKMQDYEFWFVVGSQFLYGPEVLETVAARAGNDRRAQRIGQAALQAGIQGDSENARGDFERCQGRQL